jgi:Zn-dependent protease
VIVELSIVIFIFSSLVDLLILALLISPLFLFHELAHKFVAQGNGLDSEFRLDPSLALFSMISIILPMKIIAPGVVLTSGSRNGVDISGRISMAGPLVNILLGGVFLFISTFITPEWILIPLFASKFSIDLALFNLLPVFVLDGAKIYKWHVGVFAVIFGLTVVLWLFHPLGILGGIF